MGGFTVYIHGTDTKDIYPIDSNSWFELPVLGLRYENLPKGEAQEGQLGGYRTPRKSERTFTLDSDKIPLTDWFDFINNLTSNITKKYLYFRRGDYPSEIAVSVPENSRIFPTGRSIEHSYTDGTKSIDVECAVYE